MTDIQKDLFSLADKDFKAFHSKLIPEIPPEKIIGIRTPILRKYAKTTDRDVIAFMKSLPHEYYEENNLHAFFIEKIGDIDETIKALDEFLPFVDNWATCDTISLKAFRKSPQKALAAIYRWIASEDTYAIRFGVVCLMKYFLDGLFDEKFPEAVAKIKSNEYYINMARVWYFATALAKQRDAVWPYFAEKRLDTETHNKAIRKAVESYRISDCDKAKLKLLTIKKRD